MQLMLFESMSSLITGSGLGMEVALYCIVSCSKLLIRPEYRSTMQRELVIYGKYDYAPLENVTHLDA
jgi:hypothetical protein